MNRSLLTLSLLFLLSTIASAQRPTGISPQLLEDLRTACPADARFLAARNALAQTDGGNWLGFIELVKKYGVVPKDAMPETFSSSSSSHVNRVLATRLKQYAVRLRDESPEMTAHTKLQALKDVYKILAMNFGIPPSSFTWRYEGRWTGNRG